MKRTSSAMELEECSANGDSGAEEDEDDDMSQGSGSISSSNSSGSSSSSDSGDDSGDENGSSGSSSHSSVDDEEEDNLSMHNAVKQENDILRWETCTAAGVKVKLPQDLCEHPEIFRELMDYPRIWHECLTDIQRESLYGLLPKFPKDCDVAAEMEKTLRMLFQRENNRFGVSALDSFHNHLSSGHYRPDIKKMRKLVQKSQQKRYIFEEKKRSYELAGQLLKSRESLLSNAYKQGFSQSTHRAPSKLHWRKPKPALVEEKTHLRYIEELNALHSELGADMRLGADTTSENEENYPQHQLISAKQRKRKRPFTAMQTPFLKGLQSDTEDNAIRPVFSTLQRTECASNLSLQCRELTDETYRTMLVTHKRRKMQRDNHPELNTQGISMSDLTHRAQIGQKHKITPNSVMRMTPAKKRIKTEPPSSSICSPLLPKMAINIKHENEPVDFGHVVEDNKHSVLLNKEQKNFMNISSIKSEPVDVYEHHPVKVKASPVPHKGGKPAMIPPPEIKEEMEEMDYDTDIKSESLTGISEDMPQETEEEDDHDKKELDLDTIDMMQIPIQLDDGIDILDEVKCEDDNVISISEKEVLTVSAADDFMTNGDLMQETHANFFSLLRDAFISKGEYRMNANEMKDAVTQWQGNPISPLNDWYSLATSWPALVPLALGFLAGELTYAKDHEPDSEQEFVPYLENKGNGIYAWIGAGRDSDSRLSILCSQFLLYKDSLGPAQAPSSIPVVSIKHQQVQQVVQNNVLETNTCNNVVTSNNNNSSPITESITVAPDSNNASSLAEWEPPRALYPTDWKVRPSSAEEREEFRRQERMRYAAPHKAFTYHMHGYSSVVGPVKGIYQHNVGSGLTKARGHSLLVADRPNFVTILALVRDATARLPNGEGTRADICQLLKDSQYIKELDDNENDKEGNLHSVVSGALDRLHYEADPCVRYYPKRKEWLYLHRARSESEFEMYHQQLQGVPKNKKSTGSASRNKNLQSAGKSSSNKDQSQNQSNVNREVTPKKEKKVVVQTPPVISRKEQRKAEEKIIAELPVTVEQTQVAPTVVTNTIVSSAPISTPSICSTNSTSAAAKPSSIIDREMPIVQQTETKTHVPNSPSIKKLSSNVNMKPVAVVKTSIAQSLLQSNQQHYPPHQIQVSTSAGLQTIRLSGHSVLHSAQPVSTSSTNVATIFPTTKSQSSQPQTQSLIANQMAKSILQSVNIKQQQSQPQTQQQQQHVLPGKTLLASQIKLVSSGQIKSLLSGHGLQSQTIFIKQTSAPSTTQTQQIQQQQQQQQQIKQQQQQQTRVVTSQQQQQTIQAPGMQRIIAQIGGKPIAVQIQQSPRNQQSQQQQILAKVLTNANTGQLISVENLIGQKGLKIATAAHPNQLNRQGKQVVQAQYQVVSQGQSSSGSQPKIIVSSQQQQPQQSQDQSQPQVQSQNQQTVRMVTAQLAGKPIVLASGNKGVSMGVNTSAGVVLGKQGTAQQQQQLQQPIILPSQLLNIKTLHGLKVIPTPAGLKTTGAAVYARVIAPTTMASVQTTQQATQAQTQRSNPFGTP